MTGQVLTLSFGCPFEVGDRVEPHPDRARGLTLGRRYTVTAVIDEGQVWRVDANTSKPQSTHYPDLLTRWPKNNDNRCRIRKVR